MNSFFIKNERCLLIGGLLAIFFFKIIYVFLMTDYPGYLTSDAAGYWVRAHERFEGKEFIADQWNVFPPFYHIFLAKFFAFLQQLSLLDKKLEAVLFLNIVLSTLSTYALYLITKRLAPSSPTLLPLFVLFFYGFFYPITYLNAYVLSENLATPALIFSLYLLLRKSFASLALSALFLAIAAATRSNIAILFLPFLAYLLFFAKPYAANIKKMVFFAAAFVFLLGSVMAENYRISNGKLAGLASNGGLNLAIALCRYHAVESRSEQGVFGFGVPAYGAHPEYGTFVSNEPFSNQAFYAEQAKKCVEQNPYIWIQKLEEFPNIFIGPLYPTYYSAKWIQTLLPLSQYALFGMTIFCALLFWLLLKSEKLAEHLLVLSIPVISFCVLYVFNLDQRLIYPFAFSIFIIFALILNAAAQKLQERLRS